MFGKKTKAAINVIDTVKGNERAEKHRASREAAREYLERLQPAIDVLSEFDDKRLQSREDIASMKKSLYESGACVTLATTANGISVLMDWEGKLIATYMPECEQEKGDE